MYYGAADKPLGKAYVYKRSASKRWSCIGQLYDADRYWGTGGWEDTEYQKFGYSCAISGESITVSAPTDKYSDNGSDRTYGSCSSFVSDDYSSEDSTSSYTHDFAGKLSRGKALYRYSGLHGLTDPFTNYFENTDAYIHFKIDDMGEIKSDDLDHFYNDSEVAQFDLKVREYIAHDDSLIALEEWSDPLVDPVTGIPGAGVHKISDFNVIPFTNVQDIC